MFLFCNLHRIACAVSQTSQAEDTRLQQKAYVREVLTTLGCSGLSCPINPDWSRPVACPTTEAELRLWSCDDEGNLQKLYVFGSFSLTVCFLFWGLIDEQNSFFVLKILINRNLNSSDTGIVLQGSIHHAISQLSSLDSLYVFVVPRNQFFFFFKKKSSPKETLVITSKCIFNNNSNLANNRIGGEIGGRLSTLSNLRRLVLANNSFSEPMPTLPLDGRLTHVDLSFNSFTGRFTLATNLPTTTVNYL